MKRIVLIALALSGGICSFGQKSFGVKIYQNTDLFEAQFTDRETKELTKVNHVNFSRFSLAVDINTKKGYTHEIEFLIPEFSKSLENVQFPAPYKFQKAPYFDGEISSYSLRYELNKTLTNNEARFGFNLGLGINPYYIYVKYVPTYDGVYPLLNKSYGFAFNVIPRVKYKISERFSADLNVPLKIYDLHRGETIIKNPSIPERQQKTSAYYNVFFESTYTIRLGVAYKLTK